MCSPASSSGALAAGTPSVTNSATGRTRRESKSCEASSIGSNFQSIRLRRPRVGGRGERLLPGFSPAEGAGAGADLPPSLPPSLAPKAPPPTHPSWIGERMSWYLSSTARARHAQPARKSQAGAALGVPGHLQRHLDGRHVVEEQHAPALAVVFIGGAQELQALLLAHVQRHNLLGVKAPQRAFWAG
eukprot:scaffold19764_cov114-Isochrysis_galbana.AAC.3